MEHSKDNFDNKRKIFGRVKWLNDAKNRKGKDFWPDRMKYIGDFVDDKLKDLAVMNGQMVK